MGEIKRVSIYTRRVVKQGILVGLASGHGVCRFKGSIYAGNPL